LGKDLEHAWENILKEKAIWKQKVTGKQKKRKSIELEAAEEKMEKKVT